MTRLAAASLAIAIATAPAHADMLLFALTGQSNMSGRGLLSELPAGFPSHKAQLWAYKLTGTWQHPAAEPLHDTGVGPGLAFADRMAALRPQATIALVPCARGGSTVRAWQWSANPTSLYGRCLLQLRKALASCPLPPCRIVGIFHAQGEAETDLSAAGLETWQDWLPLTRAFIAALRNDLGNVSLPFVYTRLGTASAYILSRRPFWPRVQDAQNQLWPTIARTHVLVTDDVVLPATSLHYTTAQQLVIGRRAADLMNRTMKDRP